jgi:hypothetical protein
MGKKPSNDREYARAISRWENEGGALCERQALPKDPSQPAKALLDIATGDTPKPDSKKLRKISVRRSQAMATIFTVGHSTRTIAEFLALLRQVAVDLLVDVRSIPRSRTNPQFNADTLPEALAPAGITYRHLPTLGGLRHRTKGAMPSRNTFWRVVAFRNYADYAATDAFQTGLAELRTLANDNCCAIMCAEAVWWRCHRRIIADYLLAEGVPVAHIMGDKKIDPAKLTPGVRMLPGGVLVYPATEEEAKAIG